MGISEQPLYRWNKTFAGMGVAELRRLRQLEEAHQQRTPLVADLTLRKHMLHEVVRKTLYSRRRNANSSACCTSASPSVSAGQVPSSA